MYPRRDDKTFVDQECETIAALRAASNGGGRYLERLIFMKEMNGTLCVTSLALFVLLIVFPPAPHTNGWRWWVPYLVGLLSLVGIARTSLVQNRSKAEIQQRLVKGLRDNRAHEFNGDGAGI